MKDKLKPIVDFFDGLVLEERLDPGIGSEIARAIKNLSHGLATKNLKKVKVAVDQLARYLLRSRFQPKLSYKVLSREFYKRVYFVYTYELR